MALKKSQLYSSLWQSCDELRGGMDASQYKDYVLTLLFMKYVSDKAASAKGSLIDVPRGASFADMVALKGDKEIGDRINKIIARLAEANDLKGVIDQVIADADYTVIARRDAPDAVVMSLDTFNRLMETVHLLKSPANAAHLERSIEQFRRGEVIRQELVDAD